MSGPDPGSPLTAAEAQFGGSEERITDYIAKLRFVAVPSNAGAGAILVYTDLPKSCGGRRVFATFWRTKSRKAGGALALSTSRRS